MTAALLETTNLLDMTLSQSTNTETEQHLQNLVDLAAVNERRAIVYGAHGELACAVAEAFKDANWSVKQIGRNDETPSDLRDAYVFPQGIFTRSPLASASIEEIDNVIYVGLNTVIHRLRHCLLIPAPPDRRVDYAIIGSTSSYAGFADTAVYCAVKFGLLGLVRSLNEEYKDTNRRFWLFSPGTMDTAMGRQLIDQDPSTFLLPNDVAERIVSAITHPSNLFEPEVIIRRRVVR